MTESSFEKMAPAGAPSLIVRLIPQWGNIQDQPLELTKPATLIGSGSCCDIQIPSQSIADRHCLLTCRGQEIWVWDLRTDAGTCVNGQFAEQHPLRHNDELVIGQALFRVEVLIPVSPEGFSLDLSEDSDFLPSQAGDSVPLDEEAVKLGPATEIHYRIGSTERDENAELAQGLMNRGQITRYQADWLRSGKFQSFTIGDCEVLEILGTGGMSWIYLAKSRKSGMKFAIKVMPKNQGRDLIARLRLEARAGMQLNHRNIIRTFDFQETEDVLYLIMEFVPGISLQELVELRGPLPWHQACDIGSQISQGLHYLHGEGMIHRDIKPGNILIDREGKAHLLDFGLALVDAGDDEEEFSLAMIFGQDCLGTPDFMAPEQTINSFTIDPRADIYGLGCTLFYALTGYVPFPLATTPEKLQAHRNDPAPLLGDRVERVPPDVANMIQTMMAKKPEQRFASAEELRKTMQPHGIRSEVFFDFERILRKRMAEARYRLGLLCNQQAMLQQSSPKAGDSHVNLLEVDHSEHTSGHTEYTSVTIRPPSRNH